MIKFLVAPINRFLPAPLASIAAAMVWGQKASLSSTDYQMFRTTGLLHLLVLSGQNITLLVGFVGILGERLGLKFKLLSTVSIALFYLFVFGTEAPIVRASLMACLSALVIFFQTTTLPLVLLIISALIMLSVHPEWLGSASFQLSIAATAGILLFYPRLREHFKVKNELGSAFFLSLSAQIFTTPLLLLRFREVSLLALPINTLVSGLVEPIMLFGVLLSFIGSFSQPLGQIVSLPLVGLLTIMRFLVQVFYPLSAVFSLRI